jgi:hypothetical protein
MKNLIKLLSVLFLLINCQYISGQVSSVYLHIDRSYYMPGESLFFKAYFSNDQNNQIVSGNDSLHLVILDQDGLEVSSGLFAVSNNMITGDVSLPEILTEGNYIVVGYTNSMKNLSPDKMFSRIIEIRKSVDNFLNTKISLTESSYEPGGLLTAQLRFSGDENKPVPASFTYQLNGQNEEILNGNNKANSDGLATLKLQLPKFDSKENLKLIVIPSYKGTKNITGVILPTQFNTTDNKTSQDKNQPSSESKHLNIQVKPTNLSSEKSDRVVLDITVTDEKGNPVMANLTISASNNIPTQLPSQNDNILSFSERKNTVTDAVLNTDIKEFFTRHLNQITQAPGSAFIVQEKNNAKKLRKREMAFNQKNQVGYSSDRTIYEILMSIKPYRMEGGKITFGLGVGNSVNYADGALIVVDGIKMGTDASVLSTIPVPDIAKINASTQVMDIQKYSAMNSVGVIEITTKKSPEFLKNEANAHKAKSSTLFWGPDIMTDNAGKASVNFSKNDNSSEVLISVDGMAANGVCGNTSLVVYQNGK